MPKIIVTEADIAKLQNIRPGWYGAKVVKVNEPTKSKAGTSLNYKIDVEIEDAVTNGGAPIAGKVVGLTINSQMLGKVAPLYEACLGKKMDPGTIDLDELVGKKFDAKMGPVQQDGNIYDNILAMLPYMKGREDAPY